MTPTLAAGIVQFANDHAGTSLTLQQIYGPGSDTLQCTDAKGNLYVIIGTYKLSLGYILRGIVRRRTRTNRYFGWLPNGQAGTGAKQIAHYGETLVYIPTRQEVESYLLETFGTDYQQAMKYQQHPPAIRDEA